MNRRVFHRRVPRLLHAHSFPLVIDSSTSYICAFLFFLWPPLSLSLSYCLRGWLPFRVFPHKIAGSRMVHAYAHVTIFLFVSGPYLFLIHHPSLPPSFLLLFYFFYFLTPYLYSPPFYSLSRRTHSPYPTWLSYSPNTVSFSLTFCPNPLLTHKFSFFPSSLRQHFALFSPFFVSSPSPTLSLILLSLPFTSTNTHFHSKLVNMETIYGIQVKP